MASKTKQTKTINADWNCSKKEEEMTERRMEEEEVGKRNKSRTSREKEEKWKRDRKREGPCE